LAHFVIDVARYVTGRHETQHTRGLNVVGDVASQYAAGLTARAAGDGGGGALKAKADVAVAWL